MSVRLYVEGGGDSKDLRSQCREAFSKLLKRAGFGGRMPRIVASGGRQAAYEDLCRALQDPSLDAYPIMLVDSESFVGGPAWQHLAQQDHWERPAGAADEQAQLMVTCMETWVLADPPALRRIFGQCLRMAALFPPEDLEARSRDEVQDALERATVDCGRSRMYRKGRRSFQVARELDPTVLRRHLPHFVQFIDDLGRHA